MFTVVVVYCPMSKGMLLHVYGYEKIRLHVAGEGGGEGGGGGKEGRKEGEARLAE